jgi:hypothetical protein
MSKFIFVLLLLSSSAFAQEEWTSGDTYREAAYLTVHVIDWLQTREIAKNPDKWTEQNPIIGAPYPNIDRVDGYFALTALAHIGVAYILPAEWRKGFQYFTIGSQSAVVVHNIGLGIRIPF